jgi:hypothetical protein
LAVEHNAEQFASKRGRIAPDTDLAGSAFNDYGPLLILGRANQARELPRRCQTVFETDHDIGILGKILSAQAHVEDTLGHGDQAIALEQDGLRYTYLAGDPGAIAVSHHNLANYLDRYAASADG